MIEKGRSLLGVDSPRIPAPVVIALSAALIASGFTTAGVAAPAFALAGDLARKGGEGREMSYVTMGFGLGLGVGPLLAGALAGR